MCWKQCTKPKKQIASKPVHVYKFLLRKNNKIISPYTETVYTCSEPNKNVDLSYRYIESSYSNRPYYLIGEGYHSYLLDTCCTEAIRKYENLYQVRAHMFDCIIPTGSEYFVNGDFEVVSSNIIIVKEIKS